MDISLRKMSIEDGMDVYEMIQEIGPGENGFANGGYGIGFSDFPRYIRQQIDMSQGIRLPPQYVPQTIYWLYVNGKPVGFGKVRDYLNDNLRRIGGHIGYCIRPSERGKGYGKVILHELLIKAREKGIQEALLTCLETNLASRKVIESNHGELDSIIDGECHYWIRK